ncbi:hypothetical protein [Xenophilus sp. Marseille-Q4582]|uniref:hypothetical protein n=1 Tax=Xenophilus sp. Marseille-Q4582 TaxID=2866600 RepID=UPI001CE43FC7|nr:hypothetical protein [Xenophilus sp. Marseille-Q4582]
MSFKLKSTAVAATSVLHLKDSAENLLFADGAKMKQPVEVVVFGPGSKEFQQAQAKVNSRAVRRLQKKGKFEQSADEKLAEQADYLADITQGWNNIDASEFDGKTGRALSLAIYSDPSIGFIADQVSEHVKDWANFSPASSTT